MRHITNPLQVKTLNSSNDGKKYFREVILKSTNSGKPTEYGAIEIQLSSLPDDVCEKIKEARQPLGGILNEYRIPIPVPLEDSESYPDGPIIDAFGEVESDYLYGRSNQISGFNQETIARIVEILPAL